LISEFDPLTILSALVESSSAEDKQPDIGARTKSITMNKVFDFMNLTKLKIKLNHSPK
jgi:hypothetical protein